MTIVTARSACELVGLTANLFNSVSLEPLLVLWSLSRAAGFDGCLQRRLALRHQHPCGRPEGAGRAVCARRALTGLPAGFAEGAAAPLLLPAPPPRLSASNRSRYEEGDHVIFVGEVERCAHREGASPPLFHGGKFYTEHPL